MNAILFAKKYNQITGSSVTHQDIEEWGFMEFAKIEMAIDMIQEH